MRTAALPAITKPTCATPQDAVPTEGHNALRPAPAGRIDGPTDLLATRGEHLEAPERKRAHLGGLGRWITFLASSMTASWAARV